MSDLSGRLSGGQAISGSLSGGSVLRGGLSMGGGVSPELLLDKADVITDTASGSIVSISDGMASPVLDLSVGIEPIQDLHGYDNPWPAGGGDNVFDLASAFTEGETVTTNNVTATFSKGYLKITGANDSGSSFNIVYKYISGTLGAGTYISPHIKCTIRCNVDSTGNANYNTDFTAESSVSMVAFYVTISASSDPVDINIPMMLVKGTTRPTAYSPYANLCPISGRSEVSVTRTGKNMLKNGIIASSNLNPFTFASSQFFKAGVYTISFQSTTATSWRYFVRGFDSSGNILPDGFMTGSGMTFRSDFYGYLSGANITNLSRQITLNKDCNLVFGLVLGDVTDQTTVTGAQLELGATATAYEPYNGQTVTLQLGQTVYGGTVDVTEGKLTITDVFADGGTLTWVKASSAYNYGMFSFIPTGYPAKPIQNVPTVISSQYKSESNNSASSTGDCYTWARSRTEIKVKDEAKNSMTASEFKTAMTGVQFCWKLETPTEVTLTAEELDILFGDNNIWSDSGDTTVEYRADTKLWILKKIAQALNA